MSQNLVLSDEQYALILELLEGEQKQLLVEIRHTDAATFRRGLQDRLKMVESILVRLGHLVE